MALVHCIECNNMMQFKEREWRKRKSLSIWKQMEGEI